MNHLSVCTIIRDDIKFVEGLIHSTLHFLGPKDEWLIEDGGSTDGTYEFLQSINDERVKLFRKPQKYPVYGWGERHRNDVLHNRLSRETSNEWNLFLDADESFPEGLFKEIPDLINSDFPYLGYYFPTYNFYLSPTKYLGDKFFYPDLHLRLAKKSETMWMGADHCSNWRLTPLKPFSPLEIDVKVLDHHLFHYGRVNKRYRRRRGKEPVTPLLKEFGGIHPREEFNKCGCV